MTPVRRTTIRCRRCGWRTFAVYRDALGRVRDGKAQLAHHRRAVHAKTLHP
jgi:hypothetical protein